MNRFTKVFLICLAAMILTAIPTSAAIFTGDDWSFNSETGTLTVTSNAGTNRWRMERDGNFEYADVMAVEISDGVTTILGSAFERTSIASAIIPDSVTRINMRAFRDTALTEIVIPDSVAVIRYEAFRNAELTSVIIGRGVERIYDGAFERNPALASVTFRAKTPPLFSGSHHFDGSNPTIFVPHGANAAFEAALPGFTVVEQIAPPPTGITDISAAMYAMLVFAALSAGLWKVALRGK